MNVDRKTALHSLSARRPGFNRGFVVGFFVPALVFAAALGHTSPADDLDDDGIPDTADLDQDNDGISNWVEGYQLVTDPYESQMNEYAALPVELSDVQSGQLQGSSFRYELADTTSSEVRYFQSTVQSSTTTINWSSHGSYPKVQLENPGEATIRWVLQEADSTEPVSLNVDFTVSDLDSERSESIAVNEAAIIGYSLDESSNIGVSAEGNGKLIFTASANQGSQFLSGAVTLHIRDQLELEVTYRSAKNTDLVAGLDNHRAGFRHQFSGVLMSDYFPLAAARDTDSDGTPDHRDLDSDNDGVTDVVEASGTDVDQDGRADGTVNNSGIPESAGTGLPVTDNNGDGVADPYDFSAGGSAANQDSSLTTGSTLPDLDNDNDGLTNSQEQQLGTNPDNADTDGDGQSDSEEVMIFHTDPLNDITTEEEPVVEVVAPVDSDGDGIVDALETLQDLDEDGVPNQYDLDSDNDGIPDIIESGFTDENADGQLDEAGLLLIESIANLPDYDQDGIANMFDLDSDQDGLSDLIEVNGVDIDENSVVDNFTDSNGDGWDDTYYGMSYLSIDANENGIVDYLDPLVIPAQAVVQDDEVTDAQPELIKSALQTGLQGGGGCAFNSADDLIPDTSLLLLLGFAVVGVWRRRSTGVDL